MAMNFDAMAEDMLEQFEAWVSSRVDGEQLFAAMDVVEDAMDHEQTLGAEACWDVSRAALRIAEVASEVVDFWPVAVTYQTMARLFGVAAAGRKGER